MKNSHYLNTAEIVLADVIEDLTNRMKTKDDALLLLAALHLVATSLVKRFDVTNEDLKYFIMDDEE